MQLVSNTPDTLPPTEAKPDRLIRLAEVETLTGLKKSSLYALARSGQLKTIRLSARCTAWSHAAVQQWIQARIAEAGTSLGEGSTAK